MEVNLKIGGFQEVDGDIIVNVICFMLVSGKE